MQQRETASAFHQHFTKDGSEPGHFNVYKKELCGTTPLPHNRRDFYKISLVTEGEGLLSYADKTYHVKNSVAAFSNPMIPYSWEPISGDNAGYFCLFTEEFINHHLKADSLADFPLFKAGGNPVLFPDQNTMKFLSGIFEQMLTEIQSSYVNKYELLRSYVQIIMHEALKIEPADNNFKTGTSSARISNLFLELLERQFPIPSLQHTVRFRNANEFAAQLSIHTNHLNRALKETTGKTTTELISERMIKEAKALLLHSNWDIAEVGYCLGFGHPSNFNIFFKKQTGQTPNHFRRQEVGAIS
jgi:AraC family transcriptional activator of pobA